MKNNFLKLVLFSCFLYCGTSYGRIYKQLIHLKNNLPIVDNYVHSKNYIESYYNNKPWVDKEYEYCNALNEYKLGNYKKSVDILLSLLQDIPNDSFLHIKIYSTLSRCYNKIRDYYAAIKYYKLAILKSENTTYTNYLLSNYINLSQTYKNLDDKNAYDKSLKYLLLADSLSTCQKFSNNIIYLIKRDIGHLYNQENNFKPKLSLKYYNLALNFARKHKDSTKLAEMYSSIGNLYNTSNPEKSIKFQKKSLQYTNKEDSYQNYIVYANTGFSYMLKNKFDESLQNYSKAIFYLTGSSIDKLNAISVQDLQKIPSKKNLLDTVKELATLFFKRYTYNCNTGHLQKSVAFYSLADKIIDQFNLNSKEIKSKFFWRKQSNEVYKKAVRSCFILKDYEKMFYFMEKGKAILLLSHLKHSSPKNNSESKNEKNIEIIDLKKLQNSLSTDQIIVEYSLGDYRDYDKVSNGNKYKSTVENSDYGFKHLDINYGLVITKSKIYGFDINNDGNVKEEVESFTKQISQPFYKENEIKAYEKNAKFLYLLLFPFVTNQFNIKDKKITIIPDYYLNTLPFEALITNNNTKLLLESEINYGYSNTFNSQLQKKTKDKNFTFTAFAPKKFNYSNLKNLNNSNIEVSEINKIFKKTGSLFISEKATKSNFLKELKINQIVHVASHADTNINDSIGSWIAFYDGKLYSNEITSVKNNTDLVVLSGCNTLNGKYEIGEGVMSLARDFFYSGTQSIISTLWTIDDRSTTTIMKDFYTYLKKGQSKSAALRNAKINFLKTYDLNESPPYYWASFIILGNNSPIVYPEFYENHYKVIPVIILILIIFIVFIYFKKSNLT